MSGPPAPPADRSAWKPRFVSRSLEPAHRRVYLAATGWFVLAAVVMTWPGYRLFNHIRPLVLGMPFSLFFLAGISVLSFGVGLALFFWELRHGLIADDDPRGDTDAGGGPR